MKRRPPQELVTVLCRATAQIGDAAQLLSWYLAAGNEMTEAELMRITEARIQLMRKLAGQ